MWSAVSFAKRLATIMHRVRHANGLGRFALVASSVKTRLLAFAPSVVHLWILRLAIQLPGINPTLADTIRQYVNGQTTFHATQASFAAPMVADTSKVVSGPLSKQPSAMSSFLRNVALAPARCGANDCGQRSPMVNGAQDITERPPVFFLPAKHDPGSPDVPVRPTQAQETRPTRDFVPWLARKPHPFTPHEVDPTCFHTSPLAGTYFAGRSSEYDDDTQRHSTHNVESTCFSNSSLAGTPSSGNSLAHGRNSQPYGTIDKVPSSEDVTQRLCDLKAPLFPHLITVVHCESALPEDDEDDDKPFYILEELSKCRQALFEHQRRLSLELYSSSENMSSAAEDEGFDYESDKENVPPLVKSTVESPTSIANHSPGYDPLFTADLASRLGDGSSVASSVPGGASNFDDTGYAVTDRQSTSCQTSEIAYATSRDTRLPLVDLTLSPASSTGSATTRVADDDNLGFGSDFGSDGSSPLPGPANATFYECAYRPPSDAVFLQFGAQTAYVVKLLGAGTYGRAYLAMFRQGPAVVKVVSKRHAYGRYGEAGRQLALNELNTWKVVTESNKPFLARLMGSHDDPENIYYLMRLHNETLGQRMRHGETLILEEVRLYSAQLISALVSLQELGIMHMDIKPDNIHITSDGYLALADFGCSHRPPVRRGRKHIDWQNRRTFTPAGTAGYWAPEVRAINPFKGIKPACDVYSTGIVILEMALGERNMFFAPMTPGEEAINEQMRTKPIPFERVSAIDADLGDMLRQMLCDSPSDRATPAALKAHPYVADLFERGLETGHVKPYYRPCSPWDPFERPSVDMEDFREPFADLAGNPAAAEAAHAQYLDLSASDDTTKPYDYACPPQYWSLASRGWPIPTS